MSTQNLRVAQWIPTVTPLINQAIVISDPSEPPTTVFAVPSGEMGPQGPPGAPGSIALGNPSVLVGLTPKNGISGLAMRSDGAPALDESITPTWSGQHVFAVNPRINNVTPRLEFYETDAAADNGKWDFSALSEQFRGRVLGDAAGGTNWLTVDRTELVIDAINLFSTTLLWNGAPIVASAANPTATIGLAAINGSATTFMRSDAAPALNQAIAPTWTAQHVFTVPFAGGALTNYPVLLSSAQPAFAFNETDGAANNRLFDFIVNGEQFQARVVNDAVNAAAAWLTVDRTLNVVDSISLAATQVNVTGGFSVAGLVTVTGGTGQVLSLKAGATADHVYMGFFADSAAQTTRSAYIGFAAAGNDNFNIVNEQGNGLITLVPAGAGRVR
jgi:hypothetical protein